MTWACKIYPQGPGHEVNMGYGKEYDKVPGPEENTRYEQITKRGPNHFPAEVPDGIDGGIVWNRHFVFSILLALYPQLRPQA